MTGGPATGTILVVRTQGDHSGNLADQLDLEATRAVGRWMEHDALDQRPQGFEGCRTVRSIKSCVQALNPLAINVSQPRVQKRTRARRSLQGSLKLRLPSLQGVCFSCRLPRAADVGQRPEMLELVQTWRPGARSRRAGVDRGDHPRGDA